MWVARTGVAQAALVCALLIGASLASADSSRENDDRGSGARDAPCPKVEGGPLLRVPGVAGRFALTFDESLGSSTLPILDILDQFGDKATFFTIGLKRLNIRTWSGKSCGGATRSATIASPIPGSRRFRRQLGVGSCDRLRL